MESVDFFELEAKTTTIIQIVKDIASSFGHTIDDKEADYIAFGHTGFPSFRDIPKDGKTPEECFRKQVTDFFSKRANTMSKDKQKKAARASIASLEAALVTTRDRLWNAQSRLDECERSLEVATEELTSTVQRFADYKGAMEQSNKSLEAEVGRLKAMIQGYINPGSDLPKRGG